MSEKLRLLCQLFFGLTWSINAYYHSSDYTDYLDLGETPIEECQNWVAPIINDYLERIRQYVVTSRD